MKPELLPPARRPLPAQPYDAILLASFGGPEGQDDVIPFLRNVTRGRGIPDERLEEVATHYRAHGGISPINEQNRALRAALEQELRSRGCDLPVLWGNRNWDPYFADVFREAHEGGHRKVLALVTSAYSSYSGCRQYRENFAQVLADTGLEGKLEVDKIRQFFDHPGFIEPFIRNTQAAVDRLAQGLGERGGRVHLMFVTHSIPTADGDVSGPGYPVSGPVEDAGTGAYVAQHEAVRALVTGAVEAPAGIEVEDSLVYQSRSGHPSTPWLEPDINDAIEALEGVDALVVVPIGFVSDHMEVLWDLDNEAKESAEQAGLPFERVPTPGVDPEFVSGLVDLLVERVEGLEGLSRTGVRASRVPELGPWFDVCSTTCCVNQRRKLPVTNQLAADKDQVFIADVAARQSQDPAGQVPARG